MKQKRLISTILVFLLGFAVAMIAGRYMFGKTSEPEATPARTLTAEELQPFLAAAEAQDFAAMARLGEELLVPGTIIPNSSAVLDEYAVASFAPHQVYGLMITIGDTVSQRVLLTMDENDKVESFMAEETPVSR